MQVCNAYPEHSDRSSEIVWELKERDARAAEEARDVTKRSLESGTPGDPIMAENFGSGGKKVRVSNHGPFSIVRTREEVDMQWARTSVSAGLPMIFFDNYFFILSSLFFCFIFKFLCILDLQHKCRQIAHLPH